MRLEDNEKYFYIVRVINRLSSIRRDIFAEGLFTKKEYAIDSIEKHFPIGEIIDTKEDLWIVKSTNPDLVFAIMQKLKVEK